MTVKLMLNTDRPSKQGKYPLVFRIIHLRKKKLIYTPYRLSKDEFDADGCAVVPCPGSDISPRERTEINRYLKRQASELSRIADLLQQTNPSFTVYDLTGLYRQRNEKNFLITFLENEIARRRNAGKNGTAAAYTSTLRSLAKFTGGRCVYLSQVDYPFVKAYEMFLQSKGISPNTVCFYLRNFRAVYNLACRCGAIPAAGVSPFAGLCIRMGPTRKRALPRETLRRLVREDLSGRKELEKARDLFMFSFYTRGMSLVDILFLKKTDISDGTIWYTRHKTKQRLRIAVNDAIGRLIRKYDAPDSMLVFPFIDRLPDRSYYEQYRTVLGSVNYYLKQLGKRLDIATPLTTYVARHSWATQAKEMGAPVTVISEGLGHSSEKTTRIYLKEFDRNVVDGINDSLADL